MGAGTELFDLQTNLRDTRNNIIEVRSDVRSVETSVKHARQALEYVQVIEDQADGFGKQVDKMLLTVKVMEKAGPLKLVAKAAKGVLEKLKTVANKIESEAQKLNQKIEDGDYIQKLENAENKLDDLQDTLLGAAIKVEEYRESTDDLIDSLDLVDSLDGPGDTLAPFSTRIDDFITPINSVLEGINDTYTGIRGELSDFQDGFRTFTFNPLITLASKFSQITGALAFLNNPLDVVYSVLKPIEPLLDVIGFIFSITVEPVLNFILDKTGINDLLESMADEISKLLPDANFLDGVGLNIDEAFAAFGDFGNPFAVDGWDIDLGDMLQNLLDNVFGEFGDDPTDAVIIGTPGDDTLLGTAADDVLNARGGDDVIHAYGGNDMIFASGGNDTIFGGEGFDRVQFRGDFAEYSFSQEGEGGPIVFYHDNPSSYKQVGFEVIHGVEEFYFRDGKFSLTDLLENVFVGTGPELNGTNNNDFLYGQLSSITINGRGGDDRITGSDMSDTLYGGNGDDIFISKKGADSIDGGNGSDTWVYANNPDSNSLTKVDLTAGTAWDGDSRDTFTSIENIRIQDGRDVELRGSAVNNRLIGNTGRDWIDGKAGNDLIFGGENRDLLIGGAGVDSVYGGADFDILIAGGTPIKGKGDFYDGGEQNDMLIYSTYCNGIDLDPEHSSSIDSQDPTDSVRIYTETGKIERLNAAGTKVIATDTAVNIEIFAGSNGTDTLYGSAGTQDRGITINGCNGDDVLFSGGARETNGGAGDDMIYLTLPDQLFNNTNFDGGGGLDTLDTRMLTDTRFYMRLVGAIGSDFRGFDASDTSDLGVEDTFSASTAAQVFSGNLSSIDIVHLGEFGDEVNLQGSESITIYGHGGDDVLLRDNANDGSPTAILFGGGGDDTLRLRLKGSLYGGEGNDDLRVDASGALHDIQGGQGDDFFSVRRMDGTLGGGAGYDRLSLDLTTSVFGPQSTFVDLQTGVLSALGGSVEIKAEISGFEEIIGSVEKTDRMYGTNAKERFVGRGGDDTLDGRDGDDQLFGGAGSDRLFGGAGNDLLHSGLDYDTLYGGDGTDTVSYANAVPNGERGELVALGFGGFAANLEMGTASGAFGFDILFSIENIIGGMGGDTLTGNSAKNVLNGAAGNDTLYGGGDNDVLIVGDGDDLAFGGAGKDRFFLDTGANTLDGGDGFDTLQLGTTKGMIRLDYSAEQYYFRQNADIPVWQDTGTAEARIYNGVGLTPRDVMETQPLFAKTAADLLVDLPDNTDPLAPMFAIKLGVEQTDVVGSFTNIENIIGGAATTKLVLSLGLDRFDGRESANDIIDLTDFASAVRYNLGTGSTNNARLRNDKLTGIDQIDGTGFADKLTGDKAANTLNGMAGNDTLYGKGGRDELQGNQGSDKLFGGNARDTLRGIDGEDILKGGAGNDVLFGGNGKDILFGGAGKDRLIGGQGGDMLTGGAKADVFAFTAPKDSNNSSSADIILDFGTGADKIDISDLVAGRFKFIGSNGFSGTGAEARATRSSGDTLVRLDLDGDGAADMKIVLQDFGGLSKGDFIL